MQLIAPLPGEEIIILLKDLKKIMQDKKNESKLRSLTKAVCRFLLNRFFVMR
jgi:hypothetical protein